MSKNDESKPQIEILYEDEITTVSTTVSSDDNLSQTIGNIMSFSEGTLENLLKLEDCENFLNIDQKTKNILLQKIKENLKENGYKNLYKRNLNVNNKEALEMATKSAYDSLVCRLGFNPTSKNWDIESKTKLKKAA